MTFFMTIFGPQSSAKMVVRSSKRYIEVTNSEIKEHFHVTGFTLHPAVLGGEGIKIESQVLCSGDEGFVLDAMESPFFKVKTQEPSQTVSAHECAAQKCESAAKSVFDLIQLQPKGSSILVAYQSVKKIQAVDELPLSYDGYIAFELPPSRDQTSMIGMEHRYDGHVWADYVSCRNDCFPGIVRFSRCAGHLRCYNLDCPHLVSSSFANEVHWVGKLKCIPSIGGMENEKGTLLCRHCKFSPTCLHQCPAVIYYIIPTDRLTYTRCAIHLGFHDHPCAEGMSRLKQLSVENRVRDKAFSSPHSTPKQVEIAVTQDILLDLLIKKDRNDDGTFGDKELNELLNVISPISNKKRIERCIKEIRGGSVVGSTGLEAILDLKQKIKYPFIHSVLFPGQLEGRKQSHVFKMSTLGPGSGVDLVNRMQTGGNLQEMWVHFDHVHRVPGWSTMGAHVYDPFLKELLTIATCEFKIEDRFAQREFWIMLNNVMQNCGYEKPQFRGFMADEASANWIAVRDVYFEGKQNPLKERSCNFHWEQSMVIHSKRCIKPAFQEEHKMLCRKWKNSSSDVAALNCKHQIQQWWRQGHAIEGEVPSLESWMAWWDLRAIHWSSWFLTQEANGPFLPTTNLAETKHSSMRAAVGYRKHLSLYEATAVDLTMAVQQSAHSNAYLVGGYTRTGPGLQEINERFQRREAAARATKRMIDLTHETMNEIGIKGQEGVSEERSVRRKRPSFASPNVILDDDSHRPEYVTSTVSREKDATVYHPRANTPLVKERKVAKTVWAIRRTEPKSKVTCSGLLMETSQRCGALINNSKICMDNGMPAPCFWGRRLYPGSTSASGGIREGFVWFCGTTSIHCWNIDTKWIVEPPGPAPGVWPVMEGCNLSMAEFESLQSAGFTLEMQMLSGISGPLGVGGGRSVPSSNRPKYRNAKIVRWRSKLTKQFHEKIQKGQQIVASVAKEDIIKCNEMHLFHVSTEGSRSAGVHYVVTISEFPGCSCPDFLTREAKHEAFLPCKHLYFVYLQVLNLDANVHEFMHQAALTKVELFQALSGRRYHAS